MKNLKLTDLKVSSFATSNSEKVKGGSSHPGYTGPLCDETITIRWGTCSQPCYDIP